MKDLRLINKSNNLEHSTPLYFISSSQQAMTLPTPHLLPDYGVSKFIIQSHIIDRKSAKWRPPLIAIRLPRHHGMSLIFRRRVPWARLLSLEQAVVLLVSWRHCIFYEPCLSNYGTVQCALWGKGRCFINAKQLNGLRVMNPLLAIIITKHESTPPPTTKELFSLPVWRNIKRAARHCWTGLSPCTHSRRPNNLFHRLNSIYRNPLRHRNRDGLPN